MPPGVINDAFQKAVSMLGDTGVPSSYGDLPSSLRNKLGDDASHVSKAFQQRTWFQMGALPFIMKLVSVASVFAASALAKTMFSDRINEKLFIEQTSPPPLIRYVVVFTAWHVCIYVAMFMLIAVTIMILNAVPHTGIADMAMLFAYSLFDFALCTTLTIVLAAFIVNMVGHKKYFRYKDEGHRALRAISTIIPQVHLILVIIPYYLMLVRTKIQVSADELESIEMKTDNTNPVNPPTNTG